MQRHHTLLWLAAYTLFVIGDSITTAIGLSGGLSEAHPVAEVVLAQYGLQGMVAVKSGVFLFAYVGYWAVDRHTRFAIDDEVAVGLLLLGLLITAWNLHAIFLAS